MDLSDLGQQFGLTPQQTQAALEALAPVVASGISRTAQSPSGLQDILATVIKGNAAAKMDDARNLQYDNASADGNDVLGQIFGSKDVSREVAQQLSAKTGIGAALLKKLLPIVASIVVGQVAKNMSGGRGGGLGDILKDVLGGGQQSPAPAPKPQSSPLEDILKEILGGGAAGDVASKNPQGQIGDILKDIFGGQVPGASPEKPRHQPNADAVTRGRKKLDEALGRKKAGNDADILLDSVTRSLR